VSSREQFLNGAKCEWLGPATRDAAKSLPDLITLQTEFARKQAETITSQTKDFGALTQKAMADAVEPIKEQVAKSFKIAV